MKKFWNISVVVLLLAALLTWLLPGSALAAERFRTLEEIQAMRQRGEFVPYYPSYIPTLFEMRRCMGFCEPEE